MKHSFKYFANRDCQYFPCHPPRKGPPLNDPPSEDRPAPPDFFNCLFCYCPLYHFPDCGGNYAMRHALKDCSACALPHSEDGWEHIQARLGRFFREVREKE